MQDKTSLPQVRMAYGNISVRYQPMSESNWLSLLAGSSNEIAFMPTVLAEYIHDSMIVFDVGAHTGLWTIPFAKAIGDRGAVFAFEPEELSILALKRNIRLNSLQNVHVEQIAVSDQDGVTVFYIRPDSEMHSLFQSNPLWDTSTQQFKTYTPVSTLDSLIMSGSVPTPDFVKIDVEGAELLVLEGLKRSVPAITHILVEIHELALQAQGFVHPQYTVRTELEHMGFSSFRSFDAIHLLASKSK